MLSPTASASALTATTPDATKQSRRSSAKLTTGLWDSLRSERLCWIPELGLGYLDAPPIPYDEHYFGNYAALADTDIGRRLNAARVAMLRRHWSGTVGAVVDIGIGAGTFVQAAGVKGFDINPVGVAWLKERGLFVDPYRAPIDVACCWDVIEHISDPGPLLDNVRERVLVSVPIFRDAEHVLHSKHQKKGEHFWYFTERGFLWFMDAHGWKVVETNDYESVIGREDIMSYAFARL